MIAVFIVWIFSAILTAAGAFEKGNRARTDNRLSVLEKVPWFRVPYPGMLSLSVIIIKLLLIVVTIFTLL